MTIKKNFNIKKEKIYVGFSTVERNIPRTRLYDIELVKRDILNHLFTKKGERIMNPEFGSIIHDLLFEPFTQSVRDRIVNDIKNIAEFDPRVEIVSIDVNEEEYGITVNLNLKFLPFNEVGSLFARFIRNIENKIDNTR
jgi:phage baseplate assembly protein W